MTDESSPAAMPTMRVYGCPSAPLFKRFVGFMLAESKNKTSNVSTLKELPVTFFGKSEDEVRERAKDFWDAQQLKKKNKAQFRATVWAITPDGESVRLTKEDFDTLEKQGYTRGRPLTEDDKPAVVEVPAAPVRTRVRPSVNS